jgi:flagellar assembly protein FliH
MSSKLHRGGISTEPVAWRRVPSLDSVPLNGQVFPTLNPSSSLDAEVPNSTGSAQSAYQRGFTEGKAGGRQEMSTQIEAMNHKLARTIEELTGLRQRFRHEAEEDVVALALATARRILHRELTVEPEALLGLVKAALEKIELREVHRVRVSREDAPMVQQCLEKMGLPHRVEVIADPSLERGAAILDSNRGTLDASIETQLAEIERGFADLMRRT